MTTPLDPVAVTALWDRLIAAVDEQAAALIRASFTSIVREAGDLSAAVFDRRGRMVAQAVTGTPGHINSMATGVAGMLAAYPLERLAPGDVLVTNDPWMTASQLNDITVATPVFHRGRAVAVFASCCHALDIGGLGLAAEARSIHEEGLFIPVLKLVERGAPNATLRALIAANVRTPDETLGDLDGQIAANAVGGARLTDLLDAFGLNDIEALSDEILARTEAAARARIAALPDGEGRAEIVIDGVDTPIRLRAAVAVSGDALCVDFAGSAGRAARGINVGFNYAQAYAFYGVKCALDDETPNNAGAFAPVTVRAPKGSILHAEPPSPVAGRHLVGHHLPSLVMAALAEFAPVRVAAPGADALWNTTLTGADAAGRRFAYTWFASGGCGALSDRDGLSATAFPSGVAGVPVEVMETLAPVRVHERSLRRGSGGAGRFEGGDGQRLIFEPRAPGGCRMSALYERIDHPAPGLAGGAPGAPGAARAALDGDALPVDPKGSTWLPEGAVVTLELPGGGGYGEPAERDPVTTARRTDEE